MARREKKTTISFGLGFLLTVGITMVALFAVNGILLHWLLVEGYYYLPQWLQSGEPKMAFQTIVPVFMMGLQYMIYDWCTISVQPSHEDQA